MSNQTHTPNQRLAERTILVTGAGQGIGKAYSLRIAQEGASVLMADINEAAVKAASSELQTAGLKAQPYTVDVSDVASVKAFAQKLQAEHPKLHGVINNAAIFSTIKLSPFWEIEPEVWDRVMAVNVRGPWLLTSALLPHLRAAGQASVVNIGSDAVWMGKTGYLTHDGSRQKPVHFQWQLLDWPPSAEFLQRVGLKPIASREVLSSPPAPHAPASLSVESAPAPSSSKRTGVGKETLTF